MRKSGYTPLGETLPSGQSWSENNSSSTPHGCRALKTLLVFLMLKIPSVFTKPQWVSGSYLSYLSHCSSSSSKDNSGNLPKGFWCSSPVSCQSHHLPFHAGQPWPWKCEEWRHQKEPSRSWQHDQKCKPVPVLLSGPCLSSSWRIA